MVKRRTLDWMSWLYGLVAGVITGAATAVVSMAGGQVVGAATFTPRQLLTVAGVSAIVNAALYLKQSPLPKVVEVDEPEA
jgi:hypothetical protein